jgi:hypothetical protein
MIEVVNLQMKIDRTLALTKVLSLSFRLRHGQNTV